MSGSCVIRMIVIFRFSRRSCRSCITSILVAVSRLPVGSSARITPGFVTSARASHALLLPTG